MFTVKRLNLDSSWHFSTDNTACIVDPWLIGSEIDGWSWFNEQWHTTEPVAINDIPHYDFILITQNYEDHCHVNTLKELPANKKIIATQKAFDKVKKLFPQREIVLLPDDGSEIQEGDITLKSVRPNRKLDPIYYGVVLKNIGNEAIFCAPHGFSLTSEQLQDLSKTKFKLLISTFTKFKLPGFLGGLVNPGMDNVMQLVKQLNPEIIINTHDEKKEGKGLVGKLAKVEYADYNNVKKKYGINFVHIPDYKEIEI